MALADSAAFNLTKRFRSGGSDLVVFQDLSFEIAPGESLALIGESGAGKSTLMYLLGGLDRPSGVRYTSDTRTFLIFRTPNSPNFATGRSGSVWQNHSLLPEFTALENVMMPLLIRGGRMQDAGVSFAGEVG